MYPRTIASQASWGPNNITRRNEEMAEWIITRWPKPSKASTDVEDLLKAKLDELQEVTKEKLDGALTYEFLRATRIGSVKSNITVRKSLSHFLKAHGLHDFEAQDNGQENKERVPCFIIIGTL